MIYDKKTLKINNTISLTFTSKSDINISTKYYKITVLTKKENHINYT